MKTLSLRVSEYFSLPFKGRAGVGMGLYPLKTNPIPHLTSPLHPQGVGRSCKAAEAATTTLKGEEQDKLALMRLPPPSRG